VKGFFLLLGLVLGFVVWMLVAGPGRHRQRSRLAGLYFGREGEDSRARTVERLERSAKPGGLKR
jgi:hypothetical protein